LIPAPTERSTIPPSPPTPADDGRDGPPQPGDDVIITVEHDQTDARFMNAPHTECQQCGAAVDRREPHTTAFIRTETTLGPQHRRPVFFDADCWRAFAAAHAQE
jgi:hypothetical protein